MSSAAPESRFFVYRSGVLHCEGVDMRLIAKEQGTPTYVYSWNAIRQAYTSIDNALSFAPHLIAYAVKANGNIALLKRLGKLGAGADIVSGGELMRALEAGIDPQRIVFSGVGKTDAEIESALAADIRAIHVESSAELDAIEAIARTMGRPARISLRVNPDVDPRTHPYIATGLAHSKFGIAMANVPALAARMLHSPHLRLEGIGCHIGSLIGASSALAEAVRSVGKLAVELATLGAPLKFIDAGGGWPIAYGNESSELEPNAAYGEAIRKGLAASGADKLKLELIVEPGRAIVGDAGALLTQVIFTKHEGVRDFVIVDAGMTELLRPALYDAYHAVVPVRAPAPDATTTSVDIVGPVCESADFLARERTLSVLSRGDQLVLRGAGAYAASMASNYNSRPRAAEVLVDGAQYHVIRKRERVEDLWRDEQAK